MATREDVGEAEENRSGLYSQALKIGGRPGHKGRMAKSPGGQKAESKRKKDVRPEPL